MRHSILALSLVFAAPAFAQTASPHDIGFVASAENKSVGTCAEFSCVPHNLDMRAIAGTTLSLSVFGGNNVPFLIAASTNTGPCIPLAGVFHGFALHPGTTVLLAVGTIENKSTNPCGRARGTVSIAVPGGNVPAGAIVALQALSFASEDEALPSFSRPIVVTAVSSSAK